MRFFHTVAALATCFCLSSAQVTINSNGSETCSTAGGAYCAGASLTTNIIIRCANYVGQPGNCNDNLAGYLPPGSADALCWQSSTSAGDAACSYNGTVYGNNGTFPIPGTSSTSSSPSAPYGNYTASSTASGIQTKSSSSTTVLTVGPGSTTTGPGFTVTGGSSASTITTVVPASETGSGSSGSGSGSETPSSGSGSSATASFAGDASDLKSNGAMGIGASILAGLLALGMI